MGINASKIILHVSPDKMVERAIDFTQAAITWKDIPSIINFSYTIIIDIYNNDNLKTKDDIIKEAMAQLPEDIKYFITKYNNPETHEEAKILYALGFIKRT